MLQNGGSAKVTARGSNLVTLERVGFIVAGMFYCDPKNNLCANSPYF